MRPPGTSSLVMIGCLLTGSVASSAPSTVHDPQVPPRSLPTRTTLPELTGPDRLIRIRVRGDVLNEWREVRSRGPRGDRLFFSEVPVDEQGSVLMNEIEGIQHRVSAADRGALVGVVVGGLTGAGLGIAAAQICVFNCENNGSEAAKGAVAGLFAGGFIGASVGALIGTPFHRWKTVYEVEETRTDVSMVPLSDGSRALGVSLRF